MFFKPANHLAFLFDQLNFGINVIDVIAAACIPMHQIFAVIGIGAETDVHLPALGSAFDEVVAVVFQMIEQRPGNRFDDRGFACAVRAANRRHAGIEVEDRFSVVLDVLDFDLGNLQGAGKRRKREQR